MANTRNNNISENLNHLNSDQENPLASQEGIYSIDSLEAEIKEFRKLLLSDDDEQKIQSYWMKKRFQNYFCGKQVTINDINYKPNSTQIFKNFWAALKSEQPHILKKIWDDNKESLIAIINTVHPEKQTKIFRILFRKTKSISSTNILAEDSEEKIGPAVYSIDSFKDEMNRFMDALLSQKRQLIEPLWLKPNIQKYFCGKKVTINGKKYQINGDALLGNFLSAVKANQNYIISKFWRDVNIKKLIQQINTLITKEQLNILDAVLCTTCSIDFIKEFVNHINDLNLLNTSLETVLLKKFSPTKLKIIKILKEKIDSLDQATVFALKTKMAEFKQSLSFKNRQQIEILWKKTNIQNYFCGLAITINGKKYQITDEKEILNNFLALLKSRQADIIKEFWHIAHASLTQYINTLTSEEQLYILNTVFMESHSNSFAKEYIRNIHNVSLLTGYLNAISLMEPTKKNTKQKEILQERINILNATTNQSASISHQIIESQPNPAESQLSENVLARNAELEIDSEQQTTSNFSVEQNNPNITSSSHEDMGGDYNNTENTRELSENSLTDTPAIHEESKTVPLPLNLFESSMACNLDEIFKDQDFDLGSESLDFKSDNNTEQNDSHINPVLPQENMHSFSFEDLNLWVESFKKIILTYNDKDIIDAWNNAPLEYQNYLKGEPLSINNKPYQLNPFDLNDIFRLILSTKNAWLIFQVWNNNNPLQTFFGAMPPIVVSACLENLLAALGSAEGGLIAEAIWNANSQVLSNHISSLSLHTQKNILTQVLHGSATPLLKTQYLQQVNQSVLIRNVELEISSEQATNNLSVDQNNSDINPALPPQENMRSFSFEDLNLWVESFKKILLTYNDKDIIAAWNNAPLEYQNYLKGESLSINNQSYQLNPFDLNDIFKLILSTKNAWLISQVWNNNNLLQTFFGAKPLNTTPITVSTCLKNLLAALGSAEGGLIAEAIWNANSQVLSNHISSLSLHAQKHVLTQVLSGSATPLLKTQYLKQVNNDVLVRNVELEIGSEQKTISNPSVEQNNPDTTASSHDVGRDLFNGIAETKPSEEKTQLSANRSTDTANTDESDLSSGNNEGPWHWNSEDEEEGIPSFFSISNPLNDAVDDDSFNLETLSPNTSATHSEAPSISKNTITHPDTWLDNFKKILSTHDDGLITQEWDNTSFEYQDYLKGRPFSFEGHAYQLDIANLNTVFKLILSTNSEFMISEVWKRNLRLQTYFGTKPLNTAQSTISAAECLDNLLAASASTYGDYIVKAIWDANSQILANYISSLSINEQIQKLTEMLTGSATSYLKKQFLQKINNNDLLNHCLKIPMLKNYEKQILQRIEEINPSAAPAAKRAKRASNNDRSISNFSSHHQSARDIHGLFRPEATTAAPMQSQINSNSNPGRKRNLNDMN